MKHPPHLRLVNDEPTGPGSQDLAPTDPRWVLAVTVQVNLHGTTLPPQRRETVMTTARQLGFRPFQAQAIIAVVEDLAHRHRPLADARALLASIPEPRREASIARIIAIVLTAAMAATLTLRWLL